jgi:hypothetical protein
MPELQLPSGEDVFAHHGKVALFYQLGVKVDLTQSTTAQYFSWLDDIKRRLPQLVPGAEIGEKIRARTCPILNTGVYYDTSDYQVLPTGSLIRTTCAVTHAFCAFKLADDGKHVRKDHRYVFQGKEHRVIQGRPASAEAVQIVRRLLSRTDIDHPGTFLHRYHGIDPTTVTPSVLLKRYISTFWVWLDKRDALRCSLDRVYAANLREPPDEQRLRPFREVELMIFPHVAPEVARDPRLVQAIEVLAASLCADLGALVTKEIKYQRGARALGFYPVEDPSRSLPVAATDR